MPIGTAALIRQVGGRGYFARVRLEVAMSDSGHKFRVDDAVVDRWFVPAVEVGVNYAWLLS